MDAFDFLFPEQSQAAHLRRIANQMAHPSRNSVPQPSSEIAELRSEVNFLTLVIASILKRLSETQTMSLTDLRDLIQSMDGLDGRADQELSPDMLRGILGLLKQDEEATASDPSAEALSRISQMHRRHRIERGAS